MKVRLLTVLFLFVLAGWTLAQEQAILKDLDALQGSWEMASLEVNGQNVPMEKLQGTVLTIKGTDYVVTVKEKKLKAVICLDPSKNPKELDMTLAEGENKDKIHKAIYRIEKDSFKLCRGINPEQDRPRAFATQPDTGYFVVTWKKRPE